MRLIDADALRDEILYDSTYDNDTVNYYLGSIDSAPTIEPRRGVWAYNTDDFSPAKRCSNCGYNKPIAAGENISQEPDNFCPSCGADMRDNKIRKPYNPG